jgi:hypothetical protein
MTTDEYEQLRETYRRKEEQDPPPPWRLVPCNIGGITAVGFGPGTELLLVQTHSGLGVIDVATGRTVARDNEQDKSPDDDAYPVFASGIGPLNGQRVSLAGLWGGGLRTTAPDGWSVQRASPNWPTECVLLSPPDAPDLEDDVKATMLVKDIEPAIRAMGFSEPVRA